MTFSTRVFKSSQLSQPDRRYFLKKATNQLEPDASPSACSNCQHMEISLSPNLALWCHRWSPPHRQRALKKERSQLRWWRLRNHLNWAEMKGRETFLFARWEGKKNVPNVHERNHVKGPWQKRSEQKLAMFPPPSAWEQCAACPLVSTLPSEPHMAYLGGRPGTYNSATQKGQFWPHGEHHLRKSPTRSQIVTYITPARRIHLLQTHRSATKQWSRWSE